MKVAESSGFDTENNVSIDRICGWSMLTMYTMVHTDCDIRPGANSHRAKHLAVPLYTNLCKLVSEADPLFLDQYFKATDRPVVRIQHQQRQGRQL